MIVFVPADPLLKLVGTLVVAGIATFRVIAEVRGYAAWIRR